MRQNKMAMTENTFNVNRCCWHGNIMINIEQHHAKWMTYQGCWGSLMPSTRNKDMLLDAHTTTSKRHQPFWGQCSGSVQAHLIIHPYGVPRVQKEGQNGWVMSPLLISEKMSVVFHPTWHAAYVRWLQDLWDLPRVISILISCENLLIRSFIFIPQEIFSSVDPVLLPASGLEVGKLVSRM